MLQEKIEYVRKTCTDTGDNGNHRMVTWVDRLANDGKR